MMKKICYLFYLICFFSCEGSQSFYSEQEKINPLPFQSDQDRLLINEVVCGAEEDWVELIFASPEEKGQRLSSLYVTMYYGENEPLSFEEITIYNYDRPETFYDDRFVVVHFTQDFKEDENDLIGDVNQNGYLDLYCQNYYNSLWNSDGVVAIDTDDDPENGGIYDFIAYSNRDGSANKTIESYLEKAQENNAWVINDSFSFQSLAVDIGLNGLKDFMSISRKDLDDSNRADDFKVTKFQTPGRENILEVDQKGNQLFKIKAEALAFSLNDLEEQAIPLFLFEKCHLKLRVFSTIGEVLYDSPLFLDVIPGDFFLPWSPASYSNFFSKGLYFGVIEATFSSEKVSQEKKINLILY